MEYYGALQDKKDDNDYIYGNVMQSIDTPTVIDYESEMSPVKNQYFWSSCVAFALCAVRELQENRQRDTDKVDLSEHFLYSLIQIYPQKGAYLRDAMKIACKTGITMEKYMPYPHKVVEKKLKIPQSKDKLGMYSTAKRFQAKTYIRLRTIDEMCEALVSSPFIIGLPWLSTWRNTTRLKRFNGYPVLAKVGSPISRHAVCVIGVDRANRVFKIKNSWGLGWGRQGYAYLPFEAITDFDAWQIYDKDHPLMNVPETKLSPATATKTIRIKKKRSRTARVGK